MDSSPPSPASPAATSPHNVLKPDDAPIPMQYHHHSQPNHHFMTLQQMQTAQNANAPQHLRKCIHHRPMVVHRGQQQQQQQQQLQTHLHVQSPPLQLQQQQQSQHVAQQPIQHQSTAARHYQSPYAQIAPNRELSSAPLNHLPQTAQQSAQTLVLRRNLHNHQHSHIRHPQQHSTETPWSSSSSSSPASSTRSGQQHPYGAAIDRYLQQSHLRNQSQPATTAAQPQRPTFPATTDAVNLSVSSTGPAIRTATAQTSAPQATTAGVANMSSTMVTATPSPATAAVQVGPVAMQSQTGLLQQLNAAMLIDRYLLLDMIDGSSLYKCIDVQTKQNLVCKVVNNPCINLCRSHFRLTGHPHISDVQRFVQGPKQSYLFFAQSQGDLHSYVRLRKRLRESEARRLFRQMCEVVKSCHEQAIVLRDLKLRKFVFDDADRTHLRLESLEDAVILENPAEDFLQDKRGCPAYVSPEILRVNTTYSGKAADMWSLGVILYTMLVGRYPFNDSEHATLFVKISRGQYQIPECLSSKARCMIRSLLRRDPAERISSQDLLLHPWMRHDDRRDHSPPTQSSASHLNHGSGSASGDQCVPEVLLATDDDDGEQTDGDDLQDQDDNGIGNRHRISST